MPGQHIKIRDCSGQSGTYGMYDLSLQWELYLVYLPDDKDLSMSNIRVGLFADNKLQIARMGEIVLGSVEIIVGDGEDGLYQHFFFTHNASKSFLSFFKNDCLAKGLP